MLFKKRVLSIMVVMSMMLGVISSNTNFSNADSKLDVQETVHELENNKIEYIIY